MRLEARLLRLEGRAKAKGFVEPRFVIDASGETVEAVCTTARNGSFSVYRHPTEEYERFRLRARSLSGDLSSTQRYVLTALERVHGPA